MRRLTFTLLACLAACATFAAHGGARTTMTYCRTKPYVGTLAAGPVVKGHEQLGTFVGRATDRALGRCFQFFEFERQRFDQITIADHPLILQLAHPGLGLRRLLAEFTETVVATDLQRGRSRQDDLQKARGLWYNFASPLPADGAARRTAALTGCRGRRCRKRVTEEHRKNEGAELGDPLHRASFTGQRNPSKSGRNLPGSPPPALRFGLPLCLGFAFTQRILPLCLSLRKPTLHRSGFFACLSRRCRRRERARAMTATRSSSSRSWRRLPRLPRR